MAKSNPHANTYVLISFLDLLTGALGAMIFLFVVTPKQKCETLQKNYPVSHLWHDPSKDYVFGEINDSLLQFDWNSGDTLLVVLGGVRRMPVDTVWGGNDGGSKDCSHCPPPCPPPDECGIFTSVTKLVCSSDNDTPGNPSDDLFTFQLTVRGENASAAGWRGKFGGDAIEGKYGVPVALGPFKFRKEAYPLSVQDKNDGRCIFREEIKPPSCLTTPQYPEVQDTNEGGGIPTPGFLVVEIRWGSNKLDLDLVVEKDGEKCTYHRQKTSFGRLIREHKIRRQEQFRSGRDDDAPPKPGIYVISLHNWKKQQGAVPMQGSILVKDAKGKQLFRHTFSKTLAYSREPQIYGRLHLPAEGGGQVRFEAAN